MAIFFAVFLLIFWRLACISFSHERRKANRKLGIEDESKPPIECRLVQRLFRCCCRPSASSSSSRSTSAGNVDRDAPDSPDRPTADDSNNNNSRRSFFDSCLLRMGIKKNISQRIPQEDSPFEGLQQPMETSEAMSPPPPLPTKANMRFCDLDPLDKMRSVGEKLESFIEDRFLNMGKFCTKYPKLVLFLGLVFCALMCLGYFNFKIEKDPIKLWSADSSIARKNKKYFDENFGPFYRITQLIIEPKPGRKPFFYDQNDGENVYNISALQPNILFEVFKYDHFIIIFLNTD